MKKIRQTVCNIEYKKDWQKNFQKGNYNRNIAIEFQTLEKIKELQLQKYIESAKEVLMLENQLPMEF